MQRVHAHRVAGWLDRLAASARGLQYAQLSLELGRVAPEGFERLSDPVGVVALSTLGQVFEARERRER
jgi:hypothetical protein